MLPRPIIESFDAWLAARSLRLEAIVVGGSALALLGITARQTRDFDILHPELPEEIAQAAREFAAQLFALCDRGTDLGDCVAMAPTVDELEEAEPWLAKQDANPMWPDHVRATLDDLRGRLGHGV